MTRINDKRLTDIIRYLAIPVPVLIFFTYYALTDKGVAVYIVGFFCLFVIAVSIAFNLIFFKIPASGIFIKNANPLILNPLEGKVKIVSVEYQHRLMNNYPLYDLKLLVSVPGKEPYETTLTKVGTPLMVIKLKVGAEYPVIADRDNPQNIEIKELEDYYSL